MTTIRVFTRKTKATPTDHDARTGGPFLWDREGVDSVLISCSFDADKERAEKLAAWWEMVCGCVVVGGPAYGDPGGEFTPGRFLKRGYVITSRGCPNHCQYCKAWGREGNDVRELVIHNGHNVQDSNLLACSDSHVNSVFDMLERQKMRAVFSGGLDPQLLKSWHVDRLASLKPQSIWTAYDDEGDREPVHAAAKLFRAAGMLWRRHVVACYVLCGWRGDTVGAATERCNEVMRLGMRCQAMLLDEGEHVNPLDLPEWKRFRREYANPTIVGANMKRLQVMP